MKGASDPHSAKGELEDFVPTGGWKSACLKTQSQ